MYNDPNQPQQPPYGQPQQPYGDPQYGVPPVPVYVGQQPPPKKSLRWLWITLGIIGGILVLGCGGCIIAVSVLGINIFNQVGPAVTATQYYQAIKNQDYTQAYSFIDPAGASVAGQPLTQTVFTTGAQAIDNQKGKVTSFNASSFHINSDNTTATVAMLVTRGGQSYTVNLELKKEGNDWKIVNADGI